MGAASSIDDTESAEAATSDKIIVVASDENGACTNAGDKASVGTSIDGTARKSVGEVELEPISVESNKNGTAPNGGISCGSAKTEESEDNSN